MSWSSLPSQLKKTAIHVEARVRTRGSPLNPISGTTFSERQAGEETIVIGSLSVEGEDLTLPEVSTSHGRFSVAVAWDSADLVARRLKPGILVEVAIAAHSLGKVDGVFERLALGVAETIVTQEDGTIQIGVQGLGALLGGRFEYTNVALFNRAGQVGSTLSATYTAGDPTASITSTAGWADLDSEGYYYFKIGDEILRATGRTGTSFTGVDGARLGTSAAASHASGSDVVYIGCVYGHPIEVAYKILTSTGTAANGLYDTLPADHGLAIGIDLLSTDLGDVARTALSLGSWEAEFWSDAPVDDPGTWLDSFLNPLGFFISFAEGEIICRAVPNPATWPVRGVIEDGDWCEDAPPLQEFYDSRDSVEYGEVEYVISTGAVVETVTGTIRTTPAVATMTIDLPLYANAVPTAQDIGSRTALFYLGRSGVVSGELAGLFWATLAPGDVVSLTSSWMKDPLSTDYSLTAKRCIVLAAVPDIERARVAVTLKIPTEA